MRIWRQMRKLFLASLQLFLFGSVSMLAQSTIILGPGALQFPPIIPSAPPTVHVTSISANPVALQVALAGANASDFSFVSACPAPPQQLKAFSVCDIRVNFNSTVSDMRTAVITVTPDSGPARSVILIGLAPRVVKAIEFAWPELAFPSLPIGASAVVGRMRVSGKGGPINIQSISITGANPEDFTLGAPGCPTVLTLDGCTLTISFQPTALGSRTAAVSIVSDAPSATLPLAGFGTPPATQLTVPGAVGFSIGGIGTIQHMPLTLLNSGSGTIAISAIAISGANAADFQVGGSTCQSLASQAGCSADLTFTPSAVGLRIATAMVTDTAPGSPHIVSLSGIGQTQTSGIGWKNGPVASINFTSLIFEGVPSEPISLAIVNKGNTPVTLLGGIQGLGASNFQLDASACTAAPLPLDGSCQLNVTFAPSDLGISQAYVVATDTASGQAIYASLIGSYLPQSPLGGGFSSLPQVVGTSSPATSSELANASSQAITITGFALAGAAATDFQIQQNRCAAGTVIAWRDSCQFNVIFTPSVLGFRPAAIDVSYSSSKGDGTLSFPLAGTGVPPSNGSVSILRPDLFPEPMFTIAQPVGDPVTEFAVVQNTGYVPVAVSGASITGAAASDYQVTSGCEPETVSPYAFCEITVQFTPAAIGVRPAVLHVSDSASGSPQNIMLLGAGSNGSPVVTCDSPCAVNAGALAIGSSYTYSLRFGVQGTASLHVSSIRIAGPAAADFSILNSCPAVISSGCELSLAFHPSVTGSRVAQIEIVSDAANGSLIIPLSGVGNTPRREALVNPGQIVFQYYQGIGYASPPQDLFVYSAGNVPVSITGLAISGANASDFIANNFCSSRGPILPRDHCDVTVSFTPTAAGLRRASLILADNSSQPFQSIPLFGFGAPGFKQLAVYPASISCGVGPQTAPTRCPGIIVANAGTLPLTINSASVVGPNAADFITNVVAPFPVLPIPNGNSYIYFGIQFQPAAPGPRSARFVVTSDAPNGTFTVELSGTGQ